MINTDRYLQHPMITELERNGFSDPDEIVQCGKCGGWIYSGEWYGIDDSGTAVCADCLDEEWSNLSTIEKIECLGMLAREVE